EDIATVESELVVPSSDTAPTAEAVAEAGAPTDAGGGSWSCSPACSAGKMCCPSALTTKCVTARPEGCKVPDLTISGSRAKKSISIGWEYFEPNSCALVEECVQSPGWRRLLRFDTVTPNVGTGDMALGKPSPTNPNFVWSPCHGHYHFLGYANY